MTKRTIYMIVYSLLVLGLGCGCTRELEPEKGDGKGLLFEVSTVPWQGGVFAQTKCPGNEGIPVTLTDITDDAGNVTHMLEAMEGVPVQPKFSLGRRGEAATKGSAKTGWGSSDKIALRAFASGSDYNTDYDYFGETKMVEYVSPTNWSMSEECYWPTSGNLIRFHAWWPYDNDLNSTYDAEHKTLTYTVSNDPSQQVDLLYAKSSRLNIIADQGVVPLEFHHALTGVVIRGDGDLNIAIKSLTLRNVWCKGEFDIDMQTWTVDKSDTASMKDIVIPAYHQFLESSGGWMYSTDEGVTWSPEDPSEQQNTILSDAAGLLMLLPQDMMDSDNTRRILTVTLMDNTTMDINLPTTPTWTPGSTVVYTLKCGSNLSYVYGGTLTLTSNVKTNNAVDSPMTAFQAWRYENYLDGTEGKFRKVRCKWKVTSITGLSDGEVFIPDGTTPLDPSRAYGLKGFGYLDPEHPSRTYEGINNTWYDSSSCIETGDFNFKLSLGYARPEEESRYSTKDSMDVAIRANMIRGSSTNYFDLSLDASADDNDVSANCYIVEAPGYYKFKAVRGHNKNDNSISNLKGVHVSFVADIPRIIDQLHGCYYNDGYIYFKTQESTLEQGNVIITVKDDDNNVFWQWHIWVTDHRFWHPVGNKTISDSHGASYTFHPVSLGLAYLGRHETFYKRTIKVYVATTDDAGTLLQGRWASSNTITIRRWPDPVEEGYYYMAYRWGDAVPYSLIGYPMKDSENVPIDPLPPGFSNVSPVTHNPLDIHTWNSSSTVDTDPDKYNPYAATYSVTKSIYDPSPFGWHVPPPQATNNISTIDHEISSVHGYDRMGGDYSASDDNLYLFVKTINNQTIGHGGISFWFKDDWFYWSAGLNSQGNPFGSIKTGESTWGPDEIEVNGIAVTLGLVRPVMD